MSRLSKFSPIARAVGVIGATAGLVTGVTFAALNSTATLTSSSIETANANLKVYDFVAGAFESEAPGFTVTGLIPGTPVVESFYLQNDGDTSLNVTANVPTLPGPPISGDFGFAGYENVLITITGEGCGETVSTNLALLNAGQVALPCNALGAGVAGDSNANVAGNYNITFDINPAAITGSSAGVGNFDIVLNGTATTDLVNTNDSI